MLLTIVTLNYKKHQLTISCMKSLYEKLGAEFDKGKIELIIVDNASGDNSVPLLEKEIKKYKDFHLIANKDNAGFSKGCNLGAVRSKGKYILFLNNDTVIKDSGIIDMLNYMEQHPDVSILGGKLNNPDGTAQSSTGKFYTPLNALLLLLGSEKYRNSDKNPSVISEVDWVKGGLFMIKSDVFKKLGGFDENIFMYAEDMELCYRAKLAGYKTYFYPDINIEHADQGSSSRAFAVINIYKSFLYFYKKHRPRSEYIFIKTLLRTKALILYTFGKIFKNSYLSQTYEKALKIF